MPIAPSLIARPLAAAAAVVLLAGLAADAGAQRRGAAPPEPTACTDFYAFANRDWLAANAQPGPGIATASALQELRDLAGRGPITLLTASRRVDISDATVLVGLLGDGDEHSRG